MKPPDSAVRPANRGFIVFLAVLVAGILLAGRCYYQNFAANHRDEAERHLAAIADLKVSELVHWRQLRLNNAAMLFENDVISVLVRRWLANPEDADARRQLQIWMDKFQQHGDFDAVRLLDAGGVTRLSAPAGLPPVSSSVLRRLPEIARAGRVDFEDFHRNEHDQRIYLDVLVPLFDAAEAGRTLGFFDLRIDPAQYLYPFIQRWPTPSATAETLLVRREGQQVVFLNDLRFQTNAALNLRLSLDRVTMPCVQSVLGREGGMEGDDYRSARVLAAMRTVPDCPWALVALMDEAEVYAPLRERLVMTLLLVAALLLATGAVIALLWRWNNLRFYRERAAAAGALRQSEQMLQTVLENFPGVVFWKDAQLNYLGGNQAFANAAGLKAPADLIGKNDFELSWGATEAAQYRADDEAVMASGQAKLHIVEPQHQAGGRVVWFDTSKLPLRDSTGKILGVLGVSTDITERKLAEDQLKRTLADLERSNKELEHFAYVASHDLQEPLRMVASYTQLLAQHFEGRLDDKARKYIRYAVDGAVRMQTLINDLLVYSRVGKHGKPLEPTDTHAVLGGARQNLSAAIEESHAVITNDDLPTVRADAAQLLLLFQNLLANAIKFHRNDLPRIHVSARLRDGQWLFSVKDNGIGIPAQYAERVFVIFQRLHTREEYPGTGIGLAVCRRVVERHGGQIWFESEPGNGTTFYFTIPAFPPGQTADS